MIRGAAETVKKVSMDPGGNAPLILFEEIVLTLHIAGLTQECAERRAISSVQNVLDFFGCRLDQNLVVNRDFG